MSRPVSLAGLSDDEAAALWADLEGRADFSVGDRVALTRWLAQDPGRERLLRAHRRLIDDPVLAGFGEVAVLPVRPRRAAPVPAWAMAAALAVAVLAGLQVSNALQGEKLVTARGEARRERLADGSQMHLNGATRARVALGPESRQVRLVEGEAYFAVAHDPARPFSVRSPHGVVTAVGTQFDVDRLEDATEVAVYEGRVRVEAAGSKGPPLYLSAGERARIEGGVVLRLTSFEPALAQDWRSGWVEVEDAPLADLLTELNRASPVELAAASVAVQRLPVSGRFRLRDADAAAEMVAAVHGLEVRRQAGRIVLAGPVR